MLILFPFLLEACLQATMPVYVYYATVHVTDVRITEKIRHLPHSFQIYEHCVKSVACYVYKLIL